MVVGKSKVLARNDGEKNTLTSPKEFTAEVALQLKPSRNVIKK